MHIFSQPHMAAFVSNSDSGCQERFPVCCHWEGGDDAATETCDGFHPETCNMLQKLYSFLKKKTAGRSTGATLLEYCIFTQIRGRDY